MKPDRDDPIIDAALEELLGGRTPPDLTARIMQAWAVQRSEAGWSEAPPAILAGITPPPIEAIEPVPPPVQGVSSAYTADNVAPPAEPLVRVRTTTFSQRKRTSVWQNAGATAALLLVGAGIGGFVYYASHHGGDRPVAHAPAGGKQPHEQPAQDKPGSELPEAPKSPSIAQRPTPADRPAMNDAPPAPPAVANAPKRPPQERPAVAQATPKSTQSPFDEPNYAKASSDDEIIEFVNASLAQVWKENKVKPAEPATDAEWCRRLYLRVVGRIPTVEEAREFLDSKAKDKREKLVNKLLDSQEYKEQYARHWSTIWSNLLIGRTGGSEGLASREGLQDYLAKSLQENKPYHRMVYELLTATGSAQPGAPDYNGAVNFLLAGMKDDATLVTSRTSRVFLGKQMQCAQCHHHPSADWTQGHFWALNSFFRQVKPVKDNEIVRLVNTDFVSASGDIDEAQVYYQVPSGELKAAFPKLPDGTEISPSGRLAEVNRREELARWIVKSDDLPRAYVNRVWAHFFGYGFTQPVDDMGQHNQAAHPQILERLATEFAASGYDMKRFIRWVSLTDAFGRSSKIPPGGLASADMPELGTTPLFSHYYTRQMQVEEVYDSLLIAARLRNEAASSPDLRQAKLDWLAQFNRPMGTDDGGEETHFDGSIRQSIIMMNGDLMNRAVSSEHEGLLASVNRSNMKISEKLEHLFLAALSRKPTKRELEAAQQIVTKAGKDKEAQALADVWWALLNSNEFILDH